MSRPGRVWITRARPGAARTADRLVALGHDPVVAPLLVIRPIAQAAPDLSDVDALAFTSPNGVAAFAALTTERDRPVVAVGDATAAAARAAGFLEAMSAAGDLAALAALIRDRGFAPDALILNPGAREPAGDLGAAVGPAPRVRALAVYEAVETPLSDPPAGCGFVLIHSPRAARVLAACLDAAAAASMTAVAISPAAAAPLAALPLAAVHVAPAPNEDSLLATLGKAVAPV